jgi:hypothetical protein
LNNPTGAAQLSCRSQRIAADPRPCARSQIDFLRHELAVVFVDREMFELVVVIDGRQRDILNIVGASRAAGGFAGGLNRRQKQGYENADDRNDDQQLNQRKTV